jgi:hypothetical protein
LLTTSFTIHMGSIDPFLADTTCITSIHNRRKESTSRQALRSVLRGRYSGYDGTH